MLEELVYILSVGVRNLLGLGFSVPRSGAYIYTNI